MELKIDTDGRAVVQDGKPVYIHPDGKEVAFDVPDMYARLQRDGRNVGELRRRSEEAEARLKVFEDLDPDAARKALETVKNLKDGDLVKAGQVEEIKLAARRAAEEQVAAANKKFAEDLAMTQKERDQLQTALYEEKIGGAFSRSKFIADKTVVPSDLLQAQFGRNFKVEDGKVVARDGAGNPIYSRAKPGEIADFDEALETIVGSYVHKDAILKGTGSSGSNARPPNGFGSGGNRTMSRAEYNALHPTNKPNL